MSIAYGFVRQSGGHSSVDSEEGKGTTFRLYLPRTVDNKVGSNKSEMPHPLIDIPADKLILTVDDNPEVRAIAIKLLRELGYRVLEAESGAGAICMLESNDEIDLLFTDNVMPGGMTGAELAVKARKSRPGLRVLFTSGFPGTSTINPDVDGALLNKPYRKQDLTKAIREALSQPAQRGASGGDHRVRAAEAALRPARGVRSRLATVDDLKTASDVPLMVQKPSQILPLDTASL